MMPGSRLRMEIWPGAGEEKALAAEECFMFLPYVCCTHEPWIDR